jgi:4-amino-4-deoxychorismate lyase
VTHWFSAGNPCESIPVDDRAVQYGDGLFETVAIRDGRARLWNYHAERLRTGCARLGLPVPTEQLLEDELNSALNAASIDTQHCVAKLLVSAGTGQRGYLRCGAGDATLLVGLAESPVLAKSLFRDGVKVRVCSTRLAIQPQLAGIKTLNRLEQVVARNEWRDESVFEGLLLDTEDRLICGTMSNVFLIDDHSLVTPAITHCGISGVMRRHILTIVAQADIACDVRDVASEELDSCQGGFLTNSQFGVLPINQCTDRSWQLNDLSRRIVQLVTDSGVAEFAA